MKKYAVKCVCQGLVIEMETALCISNGGGELYSELVTKEFERLE